MSEIQHWKCSICGRDITRVEPGEDGTNQDYDKVMADVHFDLTRSIKELYLFDDVVEEYIEQRNTKMERIFCQKCFDQILGESPTLRGTFHQELVKDRIRVVY